MRLKIAAWGILIVAVLDVFLVLGAHYMGWLAWPAWDAAPVASVVLPLSLLLLVVAMVGALTLILSRAGGAALGFETSCFECGAEAPKDLPFCVRCGARA